MKVEFLTPLKTEYASESEDRLLQDFVILHGQRKIVVPQGFVTDYDSVPRLPFMYWILGGKRHKAAVVHDYLYSAQCSAMLALRGRAWADQVYRDILRAEGVGAVVAGIMYVGVRLGGSFAYKAPEPR